MYTFIPTKNEYNGSVFFFYFDDSDKSEPANSSTPKLEYCEKVILHLVPHSNQLINSKHLQRPLNGLSV